MTGPAMCPTHPDQLLVRQEDCWCGDQEWCCPVASCRTRLTLAAPDPEPADLTAMLGTQLAEPEGAPDAD